MKYGLVIFWLRKVVGINHGQGASKNYLVNYLIFYYLVPHVVYQNDSPTNTATPTALFGLGFDLRFLYQKLCILFMNTVIWPQLLLVGFINVQK